MNGIILGVDPGSRTTGFAVLHAEGSRLSVLACDVIRLQTDEDHSTRLLALYRNMNSIITSYKPDSCAVETPVYGKDPLAMLKLGRAQAAIILAAMNHGISVTEYYPKAVKKSITGNGNAAKEQVSYMLQKILQFDDEKIPNDATDALAVAWCHIMKNSGLGNTVSVTKKSHQNNKVSSWDEFIRSNEDRIRNV